MVRTTLSGAHFLRRLLVRERVGLRAGRAAVLRFAAFVVFFAAFLAAFFAVALRGFFGALRADEERDALRLVAVARAGAAGVPTPRS